MIQDVLLILKECDALLEQARNRVMDIPTLYSDNADIQQLQDECDPLIAALGDLQDRLEHPRSIAIGVLEHMLTRAEQRRDTKG